MGKVIGWILLILAGAAILALRGHVITQLAWWLFHIKMTLGYAIVLSSATVYFFQITSKYRPAKEGDEWYTEALELMIGSLCGSLFIWWFAWVVLT